MDLITGIIFFILFIIIMVFAFSMGILSPYVGRKEIISIIAIGFVLGAIGGYFFINPIYEESPYVIGNIQGLFTMDSEVINLNVPSTSNISDVTNKIKNINGVNSVTTNGFELKTSHIKNDTMVYVENYLKRDSEIESYKVTSNSISVDLKNDASSTTTLVSLVNWLNNNAGVSSEFAFVHIQVFVNANDLIEVKDILKDNHYTIISIEGPVQDTIHYFNENLVPNYVIVFFTGIVGVIVAMVGVFVEPLTNFTRRFKKNRFNRP
ncbi:hypothetical protein [Methanobrevibacter olleyae]|uniref:Uncharacterized protein n=1 Tax=Methanobrevibacter olleyae TaxID=294671 RepID=A0A126R0T0_METOL|nr:hypothetical protein [Methanobrevibacter olleyae]AMK15225.1 hypothetical protein YLM1_0668 [Methanobrevibacter olleyae]SFL71335.1 hypothetical protein SAMN02910297_01579 [Methanobrevibacter olleyae]